MASLIVTCPGPDLAGLLQQAIACRVATPGEVGWAEFIPGYMHIRIPSDMLISRSAQPASDIAERRTPFYAYLEPHGAYDADMMAPSKMSGTPPVFIPMSPH